MNKYYKVKPDAFENLFDGIDNDINADTLFTEEDIEDIYIALSDTYTIKEYDITLWGFIEDNFYPVVVAYKNAINGCKLSKYAIDNGYIDYKCIANIVNDKVLCNDIIPTLEKVGRYFELIAEPYYVDEDDRQYPSEIYQYYVITENGAKFLQQYTHEYVWYNDELNLYVWGITHFGTAWDYVLTDIPVVNFDTFEDMHNAEYKKEA